MMEINEMRETNYAFRKRLNMVHQPNRVNPDVVMASTEVAIDDSWCIAVIKHASPLIINAAKDLQDYFSISMGLSLAMKFVNNLDNISEKSIVLAETGSLPEDANLHTECSRCYRLQVKDSIVMVHGRDDRSTAQGSYFLEDIMNLREAPFLPRQDVIRKSKFSPRMTHSGWGIDQFPDAHLNAIAHAGMDAILVFSKGVNHTTAGLVDFNDLIERAAGYGLDVYFYSYLRSEKHPDDPDAKAFYDSTYGKLFATCPKAKGVILVGESCEFPSKDENTLQKIGGSACYEDGIRRLKPRPGWWPCSDFPQWLKMIRDTIRRHAPQADIVFWTYNWGWAPEEERLRLLRTMPTDISLQVTFEMFDQIKREGIVNSVMDYTIAYPGPGQYFLSEAAVASERGIRLYAMSNTGGCTWDFGTAPYVPVPYQWLRRYQALFEARNNFGLCGLMESHHFGFYPSFISEFAKWMYWEPESDAETVLRKFAVRDFGESGADAALDCWRNWSEAINDLVPSNEDQYGPLRTGPSYPFIFHPDITRTFGSKEITIPTEPLAHFGSAIVKTLYHPYENEGQSPGALRYPVEIKLLKRMRQRWMQGIEKLEHAIEQAPGTKSDVPRRLLALGWFIHNSITSTIHIKQWWQLNMRLMVELERSSQNVILDELVALAMAEIENAESTIPYVEIDSRLGWEPSMEYICDRWHLEWKIRQVKQVIEEEIPAYRRVVCLQ
ncbi:MAG: hypothetical protein PHI56_00930 [Victivallaceae bacterium]|nr:hypothetical protein [Victivallaceae bacterium]